MKLHSLKEAKFNCISKIKVNITNINDNLKIKYLIENTYMFDTE